MVYVVKSLPPDAQQVKKVLFQNNLFNKKFLPKKDEFFIYFPINVKREQIKKLEKKLKIKIVSKKLEKKEKPKTIENLLEKHLTKKQLRLIPSAQEQVGSILILEIPDKLKHKEKIIAEVFLKVNKNIKTVVRKLKAHSGVFRLRKVKYLAGKKTKETIHYENKVRFKIGIEKTYFSGRSANERLRVAKQVKKGEDVLVMFSGAGPFPLVIAKNSSAKKIMGIELNPLAHQMALQNVDLNKLQNKVVVYEGDVKKILLKLRKKFDRIAMPLPMTGDQFLPSALKKAKKGTMIHLYSFLNDQEINIEKKKIRNICKQEKKKIRISKVVKCGQFSPYVNRICFDIKVL